MIFFHLFIMQAECQRFFLTLAAYGIHLLASTVQHILFLFPIFMLLASAHPFSFPFKPSTITLMGSQVILSLGLHRRVDCYLGDYLSQKSGRTESFQDNAFSRSNSCCSIATDDGIFEQPEPLPQSKAAMEKIFWRRSVQMRSQQQAWQVHTTLKHMECILFDYHLNAIVCFACVCERIFVSCFHT